MDWTARATLILLCITYLLPSIDNVYAEQRIVCYYTNWSVYRPGTAKFSPQNINPYLCTHLVYAFGGFTKDNTLKPFDKYQDIEKGGYAKFTGLKTYNKKLKTMLAIGGWNEGSTRFSPLVADPERREELIKNTVKFLRQNHFDGLDLDWEYPAFRDGGKPRDKDNYADFVQELREEFERESSKTGRPRLLVSMAIPAGIEYLEKGYDLPRLNEYLDFFNLLSYDYHSAFEPAVNHHSPLYGLEEENEYNYDSELTIDYTISYLLRHEVTPNKLVLGIPTYGRSYTLFNVEATEIGAPADGPGEEGDATREKGYLAYYEICENIAKSNDWEVVQPNPKAMGPYAVHDNQWVGYDDEEIVRVKAHYVNEKGLGGIMFWSIDNDDFRGKCHGRPYPLIEAAKEALLTANNQKSRPSQKTKSIGNRKKTRLQSSSQQSVDDSTRRRLRPETNKRRPTSTTTTTSSSTTRKRISSSRTNSRSSGKNRVNAEENDEETIVKTRPRTRANKIASRRKVQSTRDNDQLEYEIESNEEESLSNKLTTPEPPTTPDPGSDFKCQDEGFFPHPRDCKKYFWCLDSGPSGLGIVANQFTCPSGLVFNKIADSCDYPRNVICPKTKSPSTVSTTKAPITTTRTTFQHKTTRRTTTTPIPTSEEDYEYDDDDDEEEEEEEEEDEEEKEKEKIENRNVVRSTTAKPLIYKTISRNRPTTTTTTTTEPTTTSASRSFKQNAHKVLDLKDEEDPRVIKELIDLIKKAGGLEQLEKQLNLQEKNSPNKSDTVKDEKHVTPATISRSLYERVLNRQATRISSLFGSTTTTTTTTSRTIAPKNDVTERITINSRVNYQNGPGGAQFEGLDDVPEVKSLRRTNKPQYVTIERPKLLPTQTSYSEEEIDDELPQQDEMEQDNTNVASSEERAISNPPNDNDDNNENNDDDDDNDNDNDSGKADTSTKKTTLSYVNIRRTRPSTPASENDLEDRDEPLPNTSASTGSNEAIENPRESDKESSIPKFRYTNVQRFRSTTARSAQTTSLEEDAFKSTDDSSTVSIDLTTTNNIQEEKKSSETTFSPATLLLSTIESPSTLNTGSTNKSTIVTEFTVTPSSMIGMSQRPPITVDSLVGLHENFITEIPRTTVSIVTSPQTIQPPNVKPTTIVSQPRPFGFPRRGRPTTTATPTTTGAPTTTEQNRIKVSTVPTRNIVRTRARTRATTESIIETRPRQDAEINWEKVVNKSNTNTRRRGSNRYTTAAHKYSVRDTASNFISVQSSETTVPTSDSRQINSKRRRGRLTTSSIEQTTTESTNHRRRPISRSNVNSLTDSPIIRIAPTNISEEPVSKYIRGGFKNNTVNNEEKITNIKILKIADELRDINNDSLNVIETITLGSLDWQTSTIILDEVTTDPIPIFTSTEPSIVITSEREIIPTENTIDTVFDSSINKSMEKLSESSNEEVISEKSHGTPRRKIVLNRRLVVLPSTTESSNEGTNSKSTRKRKVLRRIGPVSTTPIDITTDNQEITTTDIPMQSTTLEENSDSTLYDATSEIISVDYTNSIFTTEYTINDSDAISTITTTEQNIQSINNDIESGEFTTIDFSQINYTPKISTVVTTSTPSVTIQNKPTPRFVRKKFVRKRPIDFVSTTPTSTISTRHFGFSRYSNSSRNINSGLNVRRKSLFIRKRPVSSTTTTPSITDESLENNTNIRNKNFIHNSNTSAVSRETNDFWKRYTTTSKSPLSISLSNHQNNIVFDDSSPQESTEKLGDIVTNSKSQIHNDANIQTRKIFKLPIFNDSKYSAGNTNTFWQRQTIKTRPYPRQSIATTESSVTETLVPSKKFDFVADGKLRRQQMLKTTYKSSVNDDHPVENEHTSATPQIKPHVTRLVTSIVESGTTERQIIRIKTKYSSLTSTTKIPVDSSANTNGQGIAILDNNNNFQGESRHLSLNEINVATGRTPEKSTLPIESEFSRRGRYFTTEPSTQSSTIAIESVEPKYSQDLPTLKEIISNNTDTNRYISNSLDSSTIKYSQGIQIPVRILDDLENKETNNYQLALLHLPENTFNSTIRRNILRIQLLNQLNHDAATKNSENFEQVTEENPIIDSTEESTSIYDSSVIIPSTDHIIRGFYVTKNLNESQSTTIFSTHVENAVTFTPDSDLDSSTTINLDSAMSTSVTPIDFTLENNQNIKEQVTNEYLDITSTLSPTTIYNKLKNTTESINETENYKNRSLEFSTVNTTTSFLTTLYTTTSPVLYSQAQERKSVKRLFARRRLITAHQHQTVNKNIEARPGPGNWSRNNSRRRPIPELIDDQNTAESQPHQSHMILVPSKILPDVLNKSRAEDANATMEINLFRNPTSLLKKSGSPSRPDGYDHLRHTFKNPTIGNTHELEAHFSSGISENIYDQSSRAQELLTVSIADPQTVTSAIQTGNERPTRIRGIQRHKIETRFNDYTEPPTIVRTTITPVHRRQRPKNMDEINIAVTPPRPRRPAIIDYDYYVDEEVRLSIKPELKDKLYITRTGGIRCLDQGNFAHPTSCKKFITCAPMVGGQVIATEYTCPAKLSFDPVGGICNWSAGLGCKESMVL